MSDLGAIFHVKKDGVQYDAHAYTTLDECPFPNLKLMYKGQNAYVKLGVKGSGDVPCYVRTKAGGLYQVLAATTVKKEGQIYVANGASPWYGPIWNDNDKVTNVDESVSGQATVTCNGVTDMSYMFYPCQSLTAINLSNFDTAHVTNVSGAFYQCTKLTYIDLTNCDTSHATNMNYMFYECNELATVKGVIDMKSCEFYNYMFRNCYKLTGVKIKNPPADFNGSGLSSSQYTIVS